MMFGYGGSEVWAEFSRLLNRTTSMQDACPTSKNGDDEMRHLTPAFALGALHRGKQIEQFLGAIERDGRRGLRWIAVSPGRAGLTVYLSEVEDVGTDTFRDVTESDPGVLPVRSDAGPLPRTVH
ncbi:hypothetical protein OHA02_52555 [Streptomyces phaeochromogenes]|nr:hypothetical protein [Streptomyces phaeochromogenes]